MNNEDCKIASIAEGVWAIEEKSDSNVMMYLVVGKEKALLIDTGWGTWDLPELIRSLTELPVTAVCTHGHPDHVLGGSPLKELYLADADRFLLEDSYEPGRRRGMAQFIQAGPHPEGFNPEEWVKLPKPEVLPMPSGMRFDLGDRTIEARALPGHSPGSMVFFDDQDRLLFTGDSILPGDIWMHLRDCMPLGTYWENLRELAKEAGRFDRILPGHSPAPIGKDVLEDLIEGIAEILEGRIQGELYHTFIGDGLRCRFQRSGVVYDPSNM